jgi:mRNA interferase MazF
MGVVMHQYDIVWANLDPTVGHEIKKIRPCVIISPDEMNNHLGTVIIALMTTKSHPYPFRVKLEFLRKQGWIALDQIRTIDKRRISEIGGQLTSNTTIVVKFLLAELFVK